MRVGGCKHTKTELDHDVIIVGAGPAGTSTAIRLAALGFNVGIIERLQFPRPHVGICLSDQTLALLDYLAPHNSLRDTKYWPRNVTAVKWGTSETTYVRQPGLHVDRGTLDQCVLRKACVDGVTVYQPASLIHACPLEGWGWRIAIVVAGRRRELETLFLVEATGRSPALPDIPLKDSPPLVALHASWELKEDLEFDGLIESGNEAWLWYAQTAARRAVVSVFCAPQSIRARSKGNLQACYLHLLRQFRILAPYNFSRQCSHPRACDATSRHSANAVSDHHIRVGDACLSVDPLSSQGVHLALLSGIQAAVIINSILRKPQNFELAKRFFCSRIAERVARYTERTRNEYARVSAVRPESFWHERADGRTAAASQPVHARIAPAPPTPRALVSVAPEVVFTKEPVIEGNFVEERMVVRHPGIEGAIAFVGGMDLSALLSILPARLTYEDIPMHWRELVPAYLSDRLRSWLWEKRILVNTHSPNAQARLVAGLGASKSSSLNSAFSGFQAPEIQAIVADMNQL